MSNFMKQKIVTTVLCVSFLIWAVVNLKAESPVKEPAKQNATPVCNIEENPFDFSPYQYFVPAMSYDIPINIPLKNICSVKLFFSALKKKNVGENFQNANGTEEKSTEYESREYIGFKADIMKVSEDKWNIRVYIPSRKELEAQGYFAPLSRFRLSSYISRLQISSTPKERGEIKKDLFLRIVDPVWARLIAFISLLLLTWMGWLFLRGMGKLPAHGAPGSSLSPSPWTGLIKFPLALSTTPGRRYSLSLFQVVIWTYLTVFGIVFVWIMTRTFLQITPQVLGLLGIGGGTAAFAKIQTVGRLQRIPLHIRKLLDSIETVKNRVPRVSDLISGDEGVSLVKFQSLAFTFVVAVIVGFEIYSKYAFPALSENFLVLMGISSAVYLGNNLSKPVSETELNDKIADFEKFLEENPERVQINEAGELNPEEKKRLLNLKVFIDAYMQ